MTISRELEVLDEKVIAQQGSFRRVKRWVRGKHPELGVLLHPGQTLTGDWETVIEKDVIRPIEKWFVRD